MAKAQKVCKACNGSGVVTKDVFGKKMSFACACVAPPPKKETAKGGK